MSRSTVRIEWVLALLFVAIALFLQLPQLRANVVAVGLLQKLVADEPAATLTSSDIAQLESNSRLRGYLYCSAAVWPQCEETLRSELLAAPSDPLSAFYLGNAVAAIDSENAALPFWQAAGSGTYVSWAAADDGSCECSEGNGYCMLQRAVRIAPTSGISLMALAEREIGCGRWEAAYPRLQDAMASDQLVRTERHALLLQLAQAAHFVGRPLAESVGYIEEAIKLQPLDPWSRIRLCSIYREQGQQQLALAQCEQAVELAPQLSHVYYYRGRVFEDLEERSKAIADYHMALAKQPGLIAAAKRLKILNNE